MKYFMLSLNELPKYTLYDHFSQATLLSINCTSINPEINAIPAENKLYLFC